MKLQRFWIAGKITAEHSFGSLFEVADTALLHQLKNVFRFKIGYELVVFDGDGQDHECLIREFLKDKIILEIKKSYPSRYMPDREIWLCASIIKKDNFEWIVGKATELGVSHIIPILSDRSEKKSLNMERLEKIVVEASEQSGRGNVPTIHQILKLEESIEYFKEARNSKHEARDKSEISSDKRSDESVDSRLARAEEGFQMLAFHTEGESVQGETLYKDKLIALFIGPEGGWSEKEVELFHKNNIPLKCLGKQVLRAETAAVVALSQFVFV
jgi:16S rRNA (uracil1498-N3)-methyltransferase